MKTLSQIALRAIYMAFFPFSLRAGLLLGNGLQGCN